MRNQTFNRKVSFVKKNLLLGLLVALITVFLNAVIMITYLKINFIPLWWVCGIISIILIKYSTCLLVRGLLEFSTLHASVEGEGFIFESPVIMHGEEMEKNAEEITADSVIGDIDNFLISLNTDDQFRKDFIDRFNLYEYNDRNN